MSSREPELDPELDWLRRGHRSERAPDALRRRALAAAHTLPVHRERPEREGRLPHRLSLAVAAAVAGGVCFVVARHAVDDEHARSAELSPPASDVVPVAEPSGPRSSMLPACPEPLPTSPWNPFEVDIGNRATGFEAGVFDTETRGCGPLTRRYLVRMPTGDATSAPLLIVLHDGGQSPAQLQVVTRWWFNDLARRERAVLVYANGALSTNGAGAERINGGVWQTDEEAHPAVDDFDYLERLIDHVRAARRLAPAGDVFLAGLGSGGLMALAAAARHPETYAGAAAFLPGRAPKARELAFGAPPTSSERRLQAIFVLQDHTLGSNDDPSALPRAWAAAFDSDLTGVRVSKPRTGVERAETALAGSIALGIVRLSGDVDPFPLPGGDDALARAASERRPSFFDGPAAAWAFLRPASPRR